MKSRFIVAVAVLLFGFAGGAKAQDLIYTLYGKPIEARITEIGRNSLYYKAFDNPDGPVYKMSLEFVTKVMYENGKEERFYDGYRSYSRFSKQELTDYIGFSMYGSDYRKARAQQRAGKWLTAIGGTVLAFAAVNAVFRDDGDYLAPFIIGVVGVTDLGISIPILVKANRKLDAMLDDYVESRSADHTPTLSLGTTNSGVGLSLNF